MRANSTSGRGVKGKGASFLWLRQTLDPRAFARAGKKDSDGDGAPFFALALERFASPTI
jgi:hypothetical protein